MSSFIDSVPSLKAFPAGRDRLLAQIMILACLSVSGDGGGLGLDIDGFYEGLEESGFHVDATDHQVVIRQPQ